MEETDGVDALVQHPVYHGVCLGFWYTAQASGVQAMRGLSAGAIADAIFGSVDIPTDPSTRQYVVAACESWLREKHNFWGLVFQDDGAMVWSTDFVQTALLTDIARERLRVCHNFPVRGTLCLRTPLPPTVWLEETEDLPPMFIIAETRLALSFNQTIIFKPEFSVQLPGRLEDGRAVDRAVFGWPTVLASERGVAWRKLIPQALIAKERVVAYTEEEEQLLAELDEVRV
jgi:hypothetical protein